MGHFQRENGEKVERGSLGCEVGNGEQEDVVAGSRRTRNRFAASGKAIRGASVTRSNIP